MPNLTATDIESLCDNWCAASSMGGLGPDSETAEFRLLKNGVVFHELDHETLCRTLISLSKVLLRPGFNSITSNDHMFAWSWCGQLLVTSPSSIFADEQREIQSLYQASIHAALAGCRKPPQNGDELRKQLDDERTHHSKHANQLLEHSSLVLAYLTFPLLEAVLKRACANYVALDGYVLKPFSVPDPKNPLTSVEYRPAGAPGKGKKRCNSLRDFLFLHSTYVALPDHKNLLDLFRSHLSNLDKTQDPFDLIYGWRNQSLHGSTNFQTIGGTMLSLALLISLFEIQQDFEERRLKTVDYFMWIAQLRSLSAWSFYPPY
ncbi:hypothetical protein [Pseudomonas reactans]|uniref:hypothetical protein n=1 Tax=Pseudomonas reactans TaxID=117680 RepID=UPI0015A39753|nr:hypothetical protein [Pseudomonas reactans]NWA67389.1 hypothetical protein [Pseudomonas reactans]